MSVDKKELISDEIINSEFRKVIEIVTTTNTTWYYKGVKLPGDIFELLDDLVDTSATERIVIYDSELANLLEDEGIVSRNSRGSYANYDTAILKAFKMKLSKYIRGE